MKTNYLFTKNLMLSILPFIRFLFACIFLPLFIFTSASAFDTQINEKHCISLSVNDQSYSEARKTIIGLSEVVNSKKSSGKNRSRYIVNPALDKTVFHRGMCFWEITLYEDVGDHLVFFNTYQSSLRGGLVYKVDAVDPNELIIVK